MLAAMLRRGDCTLGAMTDLLDVLHAVTTKDQHTTPTIAAGLGASEVEAERVLREAERRGWIEEGLDESINVGHDFDRQRWHITQAGWAEMNRLEDETGRRR